MTWLFDWRTVINPDSLILLNCSISRLNRELTCADGIGTTTKIVPTEDGGLVQQCTESSWTHSANLRRRHSHCISQLQSIWSPATVCHMGGFTTSRDWVEQYSSHCLEWDYVLRWLDHGFRLEDPLPYGQIDEWAFSYDRWYVTGWIVELCWRVTGRRILWRLLTITFAQIYSSSLRILPIQSQLCTVWKRMAGRNSITASDGLKSEIDRCWRWIAAGDGLRPDIVSGQSGFVPGNWRQEMDLSRLIMGDR